MVHQWGFFGSISAIRKIWSLTANSRSLQAAALKPSCSHFNKILENKYETEKYIAFKSNKIVSFHNKWKAYEELLLRGYR